MADPEQGATVINRYMFLNKEKRKRTVALLKEQVYDFGSATTLHGLRYVTDRRLSVVEKILWFVIFLVSIGFCIYRINDVWTKWRESPVIVTFNERLVNAGSVPFPSVTICPQMKTKASVFNYTDVSKTLCTFDPPDKKITTTQNEIFEDLMLICKDFFSLSYYKVLKKKMNRDNSSSSPVKNLMKVAPNIDDVFVTCEWRGVIVQCGEFFKTVVTAEGICFNMNSIQAQEMFHNKNLQSEYEYIDTTRNETKRGWDINGYYDPNEKNPYPKRGRGNGVYQELEIYFSEKFIDRDGMCNSVSNGFKVYIQNPNDMPSSSMHHYVVSRRRRTSLALKFNIISTAENLRYVSSEIRQCFFPDERPLRYFKIYTASNCNIECLANITYKLCKCVGFYMPRETNQKLCTYLDLDCMKDAQETLVEKEANYIYLKSGENTEACNCLPSCNSVDYDADLIRSDYKPEEYLNVQDTGLLSEDYVNWTKSNTFSMISIYYKQPTYISIGRSEMFGITDFLANSGGLLGLFLGFSFLSLVEIFYFISLRLWCSIKKETKEEKLHS